MVETLVQILISLGVGLVICSTLLLVIVIIELRKLDELDKSLEEYDRKINGIAEDDGE